MDIYSDDETEGQDEEAQSSFFSGRDGVIFAIDCCKEMFEVTEDGESPFVKVISAIHDMFLNKIISSDKDLHGVVFFGTEEKNNPSDFSHIYEWSDFDVPCIKSIMQLRDMQNVEFDDFNKQFGCKPDHQMSDVLWACLNMFSATSYKLANKDLIIFTWNDQPHFGDVNACKRAKAKASDLHDHHVNVQVLSFNTRFKHSMFYKDIISDPDGVSELSSNPLDSITNLYSYLLQKCTKQRPLARVPLQLAEGLTLSVGVYTVTRRATKSAAVWLDSATNKQAFSRTNLVDTNSGEILMPSDIKLKQTWVGRDAVFEKEEVEAMKKVEQFGLKVLGFKPREKAIKLWFHVRNAQFIYPDEQSIKGSTALFADLLTKCLEMDVVAICTFVPRANSAPRCVALLPQAEETDPESCEQIKPPGFYVIFLPYSDDIREIKMETSAPKANAEQISAAEAMIRKLRFTYKPENFDNPALQTHFRNLEAMALEKDEPEPIEDHTKPDLDRIEKKAGDLIRDFKDLVFSPGYDPNKAKNKRKTDGSGGASAVKKPKADLSLDEIQTHVANDSLGKLTVQTLKEVCKLLDIKAPGKKADVISAITEHVHSSF